MLWLVLLCSLTEFLVFVCIYAVLAVFWEISDFGVVGFLFSRGNFVCSGDGSMTLCNPTVSVSDTVDSSVLFRWIGSVVYCFSKYVPVFIFELIYTLCCDMCMWSGCAA